MMHVYDDAWPVRWIYYLVVFMFYRFASTYARALLLCHRNKAASSSSPHINFLNLQQPDNKDEITGTKEEITGGVAGEWHK